MERCTALRQYTELERPWDRLVGGLVLGSETFARQLRKKLRANAREQPALRKLEQRLQWTDIISELEQVKGEKWEKFSPRHGDWGDAALWLGRRRGRYTLSELGNWPAESITRRWVRRSAALANGSKPLPSCDGA